jgi:Rrf2 family nitric oxide-sensitive transcriptional repressor
MQLTRFTDYALRALIFLGGAPQRLCTIQEIAQAYGISENHLMKVVHRLSTSGYVETMRGKGGGIRLARTPSLINVGAVVRDMEERFDIVECFRSESQDCPLLPACTLKSALSEATRNFLATLDRFTIEDCLGPQVVSLLANRGAARALLRVEAR